MRLVQTKTPASSREKSSASRDTNHYSVYVVYLRNPKGDGKAGYYVGMTGLSPDVRFDKHKAGIQANRYVMLYGLRLMPELYQVYNPMPYDGARDMEVELAIALREKGYGVWQG